MDARARNSYLVVGGRWICSQAAKQGLSKAQHNLANYYGQALGGLALDHGKAAKWLRRAAAQGDKLAQEKLAGVATFPIDSAGMRVVVVGLTSAAAASLNGCQGLVQKGRRVKPGRAAVLLDGNAQPSSIRLANLRKAHVL